MSLAYRPRGVPELIDAAFQLMRRHYVPLLVLAAVTYIPTFAVLVLISAPAAMAGSAELTGAMGGLLFALMPFLLAWYAVGVGAMAFAASEGYQGRPVDPGSALRVAFRRWWPIVKASVAKWFLIGVAASGVGLVVGVGAVISPFAAILALPAIALPIMVWTRFFAVPTVTVLEELGAGDSLRRSARLSDGFRWKILGTYVVVYAIVVAITMAAMFTALLLVKNLVLAQLASNLLSLLGYPLLCAIGVVLYYDMRIRKEGFDLELMQRELSVESAGQPV